MLNERTADTAVEPEPIEPSPSRTVAGLRLIADFLDGFPGLPGTYVTVGDFATIGLQFPSHAAEPTERCLAVARIAQQAGGVALVSDAGGIFETHVRVGDRLVHVYTLVEKPCSVCGRDAA